jgi:hypothetical protein
MQKHLATLVGLALVLAFVVLFMSGRRGTEPLAVVAPRVGMTAEELLAMGPRIASQTGATLGTSRRVIYLMACSGVPTGATLERHARLAADIAEQRRLTPREAATSVLSDLRNGSATTALKDC